MNKIVIKDLEFIKEKKIAEHKRYKAMLMICAGTGCVSTGAFTLYDLVKKELKERNLENKYMAVPTGCNGFCAQGPIIVIQPEGILYQKVKENDIPVILEQHLENNKPVEKLMYKDGISQQLIPQMKNIQFFGKQMLIALRNRGIINPEDIEDAISKGGYSALSKVLTKMKPLDVIEEVKKSALRGRGGGGFPAGIKWESCYNASVEKAEKPYIVCNANGNANIVESDPHTIIEGMAIGAVAVGAEEGYVYIRKEYQLALERLKKAIHDARLKGLLGKDIFGKGYRFDIQIHLGAGAFVCGESSALMESMEGKAAEPRTKYVHNVVSGFKNKPTILNNVETWANIPAIIDKGAEWFAGIGSGDVSKSPWNGSTGTKVFSLAGNVVNPGFVEVPMGLTLREIIFEIGGGIPNNRTFKAVQTGGPSGGCLPESLLDMHVDFDKLEEVGSIMGSGSMMVMNDRTCMVDVAKYFINFLKDESCGKCNPCREGLILLYEVLDNITNGNGQENDLELLEQICKTMAESSLCGLGKTAPNPVLTTIKYFHDEYIEHIKNKKCTAGRCKELIKFEINKDCTGCVLCEKNCPVDAITGIPKKIYKIDQAKCIQCGICNDVCKFNAVTII